MDRRLVARVALTNSLPDREPGAAAPYEDAGEHTDPEPALRSKSDEGGGDGRDDGDHPREGVVAFAFGGARLLSPRAQRAGRAATCRAPLTWSLNDAHSGQTSPTGVNVALTD